jgi:hypothetical protein
MTLSEAIPLLVAEYWRQCHPDNFTGDITARLESATPTGGHDGTRVIEIELWPDCEEVCMMCWREQYGEKEPCSVPVMRDNWELKT